MLASVAAVDETALVIQADLLTVLAVTGLVVVGAVVAGVIRRGQATRQVRRIERSATRAALDALDRCCGHGEDPHPPTSNAGSSGRAPAGHDGGQANYLSTTGKACNWLVALCLLGLGAGLVGGSGHLVWVSGVGCLLVPLAAAPWLTRRRRNRGEKTRRRGWSAFDSWWRYLGVGR